MRGGIWILNFFALVWCAAGILLSHASPWWLLVPAAISGVSLFRASRLLRGKTDPSGEHVGRVVGLWSAVEGVAMFITANVLINFHLPDAIMPAFAVIVGLHFLPLARGIPVPTYYATGAGLIVVGTIALVAPPWHLPLAVGLAAAIILWVSADMLVRRSL